MLVSHGGLKQLHLGNVGSDHSVAFLFKFWHSTHVICLVRGKLSIHLSRSLTRVAFVMVQREPQAHSLVNTQAVGGENFCSRESPPLSCRATFLIQVNYIC